MYILFLSLAAIFNAIMDTLLWHFNTSVFKNLKVEWWNPNYSWMSVKNFLGIVRLDAWHLAKYGMMINICLSIFFAIYIEKPIFGYWDLIILPCIWSISFELFYSLILKSKKMKSLLLISSIFISSLCFSQKDTLVVPNGGIKIIPVLFLTDSAYSVGWMVSKISSDTTLDSYGEIYIYKKNGAKIAEYGFPIPRQVINNWGTDNSSIDDFIFNKFPNFKKQTKK